MDTIQPFWGEFFVSPIPLELSGNFCSHQCSYCFANLNNPSRKLSFDRTLRLIEQRFDRVSLEGQLLAQDYPVLVSNHVDPFSKSNYKELGEVMRALIKKGIPLAIQTRGGVNEAIEDLLKILPSSHWYISITHQSDSTRKLTEKAAPTIDERFELIKRLKKIGHQVSVGVNPLVPEWIPELYPFLNRIKDAGAYGIWVELLHLNYKQRNKLSVADRGRLGDDLITKSMKKIPDPKHYDHFENCRAIAQEIGLEVYSIGQSNYSDYFKPFKELYPKTFPVMQEFVNHCHLEAIETFNFDSWFDFFGDKLPKISSSQHYHYIEFGTQRHQFDFRIPNRCSYQELLPFCWKSEKFQRANPIACRGFGYLAVQEGEGLRKLVDKKWGLPCFGFLPEGSDASYFVLEAEG